jgi:hypothetical protein
VTNRKKIIFIALVGIHLILVLLTMAGTINFLFNDASLRSGFGADFFAVYQAGYNARHGYSVYLNGAANPIPYSFPFRYFPATAYMIGIPASLFKPFTAYRLLIVCYELLLGLNLYFTSRLARGNFLLASIPWLLFTPYLLELFMGQWTFPLSCLMFYSIFGLLQNNRMIYWFIAAPFIKPNALIFIFPFARFARWKLLFASALVLVFMTVPYFIFFPHDVGAFQLNFEDTLYSHGGNFGLKALYAYIVGKLIHVPAPHVWFLTFAAAMGLITIFLSYKYRNVVIIFTLWACYFFLIYKDVWEHHYVLLMPFYSLILMHLNRDDLLSKKNILVFVSFLLVALPTLFTLQYAFIPNAPIEPDHLPPVFVIAYHSTKILGVLLLYIWGAMTLRTNGRAIGSPGLAGLGQ